MSIEPSGLKLTLEMSLTSVSSVVSPDRIGGYIPELYGAAAADSKHGVIGAEGQTANGYRVAVIYEDSLFGAGCNIPQLYAALRRTRRGKAIFLKGEAFNRACVFCINPLPSPLIGSHSRTSPLPVPTARGIHSVERYSGYAIAMSRQIKLAFTSTTFHICRAICVQAAKNFRPGAKGDTFDYGGFVASVISWDTPAAFAGVIACTSSSGDAAIG